MKKKALSFTLLLVTAMVMLVSGIATMLSPTVKAETVPTVANETALAEALTSGGDYALRNDIVLSSMIVVPEGKTASLDLNGYDITVVESAGNHIYAINNKGTLTLKDSVGTGSITARGIYNGYNDVDISETVAGAKLIVESGAYVAQDVNGGAAIFNCAELIINGGTFTATDDAQCGNSVVYVANGSAEIKGGTFHTNAYTKNPYVGAASAGTIAISGGTFDKAVDEAYCVAGYLPEDNGDGTYDVSFAGYIKVTYKDGTVKHFKDILEAVPYKTNYDILEGATITLLNNYTGSGIRFMEKDMTLDLNGFTFTINQGTGSQGTRTQAFQVRDSATNAVIKNGKIEIATADKMSTTDPYVVWVFNSYTNLTVKDVEVDMTNMAWSVYGSTVTAIAVQSGDSVALVGNSKITNFDESYGGYVALVDGTLSFTDAAAVPGKISAISGATIIAPAGMENSIEIDSTEFIVYESGEYKVYTRIATVNGKDFASLQAALDYAVVAADTVVVEITADIDLTGTNWIPVYFDSYKVDGANTLIINGNGKTIAGLDDMLFSGIWTGTKFEVNNLIINKANILHDVNDTQTVGVGAIVGNVSAIEEVVLNNVKLTNSHVEGGHWTGGFFGYIAGYSGNDGPVFTTVSIENCEVSNSTITGKGSVGGVVGHATGDAWTSFGIEESVVSGNEITSTGSSTNKAGIVAGTIGAAGSDKTTNGTTLVGGVSVAVTESGNTATSNGTAITTVYGRQGSSTGKIEITGGSYENNPIEENVDYAGPADGVKIVENADGSYGVINRVYKTYTVGAGKDYATLAQAIAAANAEDIDYVTFVLYGANELETGYSHGIVDFGANLTVTIDGGDASAKLTIVGGGVPDIKGVTMKNIIFADEGQYLPTANEFMYQNFIDTEFVNVTFKDGVRLSGTSTLTNCTFDVNTTNEYAIWLDDGDFAISGSKVIAGVDSYGLVKSDTATTLVVENNVFEYLGAANKEALNVKGVKVTATGNTFIDCDQGILPADKTNYAADGSTVITDAQVVADNTVVIHDAKIGTQKYLTVAEAFAAAQAGDEIVLLQNVEDLGALTLKAGVTLNGNGKTISGNSTIYLKANTVVKNTTFKNIANANGTLSAIYAIALDGSVEIIGNVFDTVEYDALQITPVAGANITITGNVFKGVAKRYVHIESVRTQNVAFTATVTGNKMYNEASTYPLDVYYFADASLIDVSGNYIKNAQNVCILDSAAVNHAEKVLPLMDETLANEDAYVAAIKDKYNVVFYKTLQEAIDAAAGDAEILLLANTDEDVIIRQKEGVNVTINGNGKTYGGTMTIYGNARYNKPETLTIKNVNFVTSEASHYFIDSNLTGSVERYAHNVTVIGSTFTATGAAENSAVAMRIRQGFNIAVKNVTSTGMHSVLQAYGNSGVTVDNLTIVSGKNGVSLGTSTNAVIANSTINATGYGVRADGTGAYDVTVKDSAITADLPVVVRNATGDYTVTLEGTNALNGTNANGYSVIITNGDDGTYEAPTGSVVLQGNAGGAVYGVKASLNGKFYSSLQEAIDAATGDAEILLLVDTDEDVIIRQKEGVNVTINGNGKTYTGTITIHGNARYNGAETLTIQNVNFVTSEEGHVFIDSNSTGSVERYAHNVTVKNSTFTATGAAVHSAAAMRIRQGFNIAIQDVNANGMHSVLQAYGNSGVTVDELVVVNGKNGVSLGTSTNAVIKNSTIEATGYGIRADGNGAYDATVQDSTITADLPVVVRNASGAYTMTLGGTNTLNGTNANGYKVIITSGDDGTYEPATGSVLLQGNVDNSAVYGMNAVVDGQFFVDLQEAIDVASGKTIVVLRDVELTAGVTVASGKVITLDLNGKSIRQVKAQTTGYAMITNNGTLTITDSIGGGYISYTDSGNGGNYESATISNRGTLTIDNGTIKNESSLATCNTGYAYAISNNSTSSDAYLYVNGGRIENAYYCTIRQFCNSTAYENVFVMNGGVLGSGIEVQSPNARANKGTTTIAGGTIEASDYVSGVYIFAPAANSDCENMEVAITGGSFYDNVKLGMGMDTAVGFDKAIVSGGIFYAELDEALINPNTDFIVSNGATYLGNDATTLIQVAEAKIGRHYYTKLTDAVAVAKASGEELVLEKNVEISSTIIILANESLAINLNGHTLSGNFTTPNPALIINQGTLVVNDGAENHGAIVYNNANGYTIVNDNAMTINGGTIGGANLMDVWSDTPAVIKDSVVFDTSNFTAKIGETYYLTLDQAINAAQNGETIVVLKNTTNTITGKITKDLTFTGEDTTAVIDLGLNINDASGKNLVFNNLTLKRPSNQTYKGFYGAASETYNNCVLEGQHWSYAHTAIYNDCVFRTTDANNYNLWLYGSSVVELNNCVFYSAGKSVLLYNEGYVQGAEVAVSNCEFYASQQASGKAAIEIDATLLSGNNAYHVEIEQSTATGFATGSNSDSTLWNNKTNGYGEKSTMNTVVVDGVTVLEKVKTVANYAELMEGLNAGLDVVFANDITATDAIVVNGKELFIDLNGKVLTVTKENDVKNGSNVVIKNGTIDVTGAIIRTNAIFDIGEGSSASTLTLEDVHVLGDGYRSAYCVFYVRANSTMNVNGGKIELSNDASDAGVFTADVLNARFNLSNVTIALENVARAIVNGTAVLDNVQLDMVGGDNGINGTALTAKNSTINISNNSGRALTITLGDVTFENSTLNFSGAGEGEIRFKAGATMTLDANSNLSKCDIYADSSATGANVNGNAVTGVKNNPSDLEVVNGEVTLNNPPQGEGTLANPYKIGTPDELRVFAMRVNSGAYDNVYAVLTANINLGYEDWTAIGTAAHPFTGVFDGMGHTIFNLWGGTYEDGKAANGLFGYTSTGNRSDNTGKEAVIKNLTVHNVTITDNAQEHLGAGAVIGNGKMYTTVENVHVTGEILVVGSRAGGIVGYTYNGLIINNCSVIGDENSNSIIQALYWAAGGIVGFATGSDASAYISDCYVANVHVDATNHYCAASIAAYMYGTAHNVVAENVKVTAAYSPESNAILVDTTVLSGNSYAKNCTLTVGGTLIEIPVDVKCVFGEDVVTTFALRAANADEYLFGTLYAAVLAAEDGDVIKLVGDLTAYEMATIPEGKSITIDLNGYNITTMVTSEGKHIYPINNMGTLTIMDSVGGGSISARGIYNGYGDGAANNANATMIIESGIYNALDTNGGAAVFNYGKLIVNGGTFTSNRYAISNQPGSSLELNDGIVSGVGGVYADGATVTINGGLVYANSTNRNHALYFYNTDATINGGEIVHTGTTSTMMVGNGSNVTINGGSLEVADGNYLFDADGTANLTINGGDIVGMARFNASLKTEIHGGWFVFYRGTVVSTNATIMIDGGCFYQNSTSDTFNRTFARQYLADGLFIDEEDGYVKTIAATVTLGATVTPYDTIQKALAAATDGATVTMILDAENVGKLELKSGVTFNGNGKVLSGDSCIAMASEGTSVVTGVIFKDITNGNRLSAIYATLTADGAKAIITGNTFDTVDWDAIQATTPDTLSGAVTFEITNNVFKGSAKRYVHVEGYDETANVVVTGNKMYGDAEAAIGVWYFETNSTVVIENNYVANLDGNDVVSVVLGSYNTGVYENVTYDYVDNFVDENGNAVVFNAVRYGKYSNFFYVDAAKAFAEAEDGDTIILYNDLTLENRFAVGTKHIVVDLNGNTLSLNAADTHIHTNGSLTIVNGTVDVSGVQQDDFVGLGYTSGAFYVRGTLNLVDVEVVGDNYWTQYGVFYLVDNGTVNVEDSVITLSNERNSAGGVFKGATTNNAQIVNIKNSTLNLTDVVRGFLYTTLTIEDSVVNITGGDNAVNGSAMTLKNSEMTIKDGIGRGITIENGNVVIDNSVVTIENMEEADIRFKKNNTISVVNGSQLTYKNIVVDSSAAIETVLVVDTTSTASAIVAKVNNIYYVDYADALADALVNGGTITMFADYVAPDKLVVNKDLVWNLNGYTLTLANVVDNYGLVVKADLTVGGAGKVVAGEYGIGTSTAFTGTLTINGGEYVGKTYLFGIFGGTLVIKDGAFYADYCVVNSFSGYYGTVNIYDGNFAVGNAPYANIAYGYGITVYDGRYSHELDEDYVALGWVMLENGDGTWGLYDVQDYRDPAIAYIQSVADDHLANIKYSENGKAKIAELVATATADINALFKKSEIDAYVYMFEGEFDYVLTAVEERTMQKQAALELKEYASLMGVSMSDARVAAAEADIYTVATEYDILLKLEKAMQVVDAVAAELADALAEAKALAISNLMGANEENKNNVTSAMISSIYAAKTIEEVEFAYTVAYTEMQEIIAYKALIKNTSDTADANATALESIMAAIVEMSDGLFNDADSLRVKIEKAITDIAGVQNTADEILANALTAEILQGKLDALKSQLDTTVANAQAAIETYLAQNVIPAIEANSSAFNSLKDSVEGIQSALGGRIETIGTTLSAKIDSVLKAIAGLNDLSKEDVAELVGSVDFTDVIAAINRISNKVSANGELYNAIINKVNDLLAEVRTAANNAATKAATAAQEAIKAASAANTASANSVLAKTAAEQAQAKAEAAKAAAEAAKVAAESLMGATNNAEDAANAAAEAAKLAQEAAEAARDAAQLAAEKAQTATVKAHAANVEATLKEWILEYIGGLAEQPKQLGVLNAPASAEVDTFRAQLDSKLTANYSDENRALILSYYDQAIAQINAATSTAEIDYALESFKSNVGLVDSLGMLAPESNDSLVALLAVVAGVEGLIAAALIVGLILMIKRKKQNGDDDDDDKTAIVSPVETDDIEEETTEQPTETVEETAATEEVAAVETAEEEEELEEEIDEEDDEDDEEDGDVSPFAGLKGKSKTFEERLAEADEITKANFEAIKSELESYKRISTRLSKKAMSFRVGRVLVVKTVIRGKTLRCYLSLDPAAYEFNKFHHRDASDKKAYALVPMMMKVRSGRALKRTLRLIGDVAEKFALVKKA